MKRITLVLSFVALTSITASAAIKKVHLQVEGCLRTTCSRKVWQAVGRSVPAANFRVDDAGAGIAEFVPKPNATLSLRALNRTIHDAGYSLKRVAIEVDGNSNLAVAKDCPTKELPQLWVKEAQEGGFYAWTPSQDDLKKKTDEGIRVCAVQ